MKISIITVCYNANEHISKCIDSVLAQDYKNIEYIIIDGASSDGTIETIKVYGDKISKFISEKDKGIYDAMNKGVSLATGDVVGILNADDIYANSQVISTIVTAFKGSKVDAICSDVGIYKDTAFQNQFRYYKASRFKLWQFRLGMQPPHPGFFVKNECYIKHGNFYDSYRISADFDLMLRFLWVHKTTFANIPFMSVKMLDGGASSSGLKSKIKMNKEDLDSLKRNGIYSNTFLIWSKYFLKVFQLLRK